ncbi:MAG: RsmD family RNA methyltransferase [Alphaproteobacteria bacterium GM202ARS2]|nr:RsmD family RNA methyltransferase [Alphaproteobacteria bacterium GM202ARS2]
MEQRILSGHYGGRWIRSLSTRTTRSISARARETVFDMLCHRSELGGWQNGYVVDGFCGSGVLGLEALSRGCRQATFIDQDRTAIGTVRANIKTLGVDGVTSVIQRDIRRIPSAPQPCQLVFLSPPWSQGSGSVTHLVEGALLALQRGGWLEKGTIAVIERAKQHKDNDMGVTWEVVTTRLCGDHAFTFVRYHG